MNNFWKREALELILRFADLISILFCFIISQIGSSNFRSDYTYRDLEKLSYNYNNIIIKIIQSLEYVFINLYYLSWSLYWILEYCYFIFFFFIVPQGWCLLIINN